MEFTKKKRYFELTPHKQRLENTAQTFQCPSCTHRYDFQRKLSQKDCFRVQVMFALITLLVSLKFTSDVKSSEPLGGMEYF